LAIDLKEFFFFL